VEWNYGRFVTGRGGIKEILNLDLLGRYHLSFVYFWCLNLKLESDIVPIHSPSHFIVLGHQAQNTEQSRKEIAHWVWKPIT